MLELILAFGNYMNSQKKGPCYGFKLQSLDSLTITKSTDKKQHIVHYLASVVEQKYPELKSFYTELTMLDKASQFSLENIMTDVVELERGMELTRNVFINHHSQADLLPFDCCMDQMSSSNIMIHCKPLKKYPFVREEIYLICKFTLYMVKSSSIML